MLTLDIMDNLLTTYSDSALVLQSQDIVQTSRWQLRTIVLTLNVICVSAERFCTMQVRYFHVIGKLNNE